MQVKAWNSVSSVEASGARKHTLWGQPLNELKGLEVLVQREDFTELLSAETLLRQKLFLVC